MLLILILPFAGAAVAVSLPLLLFVDANYEKSPIGAADRAVIVVVVVAVAPEL